MAESVSWPLTEPHDPTPWGKGKGMIKGKGKKGAGKGSQDSQKDRLRTEEAVMDEHQEWLVEGRSTKLIGEEFENAFSKCKSLQTPERRSWMPITRERFASMKRWQQDEVVKALAVRPPYEFPFGDVDALSDIGPGRIAWQEALGAQRSDSGTDAVLFVEFPDKKAVVVKAPKAAAAEMFGTELCLLLEIPCPKMRLVAASSAEGVALREALEKCTEKAKEMFEGKPAILVIQFLKATELNDIVTMEQGCSPSHGRANEWCQNTFGLPGAALTPKGEENLKMLGRLIAFDMIINNYDRVPCIWDNKGNPGNVMFVNDTHSVISIDNMLNCMSNENQEVIQKHLAKVKETAGAVLSKPKLVHPDFAKTRTFLKDGCPVWSGLGIDVGDEGVLVVQAGFCDVVKLIATGSQLERGTGRAQTSESVSTSGAKDSNPSSGTKRSSWCHCHESSEDDPLTRHALEELKSRLSMELFDEVSPDTMHTAGFLPINSDFMGAVVDTLREAYAQRGQRIQRTFTRSLSIRMVGEKRGLDDLMTLESGESVPLGPARAPGESVPLGLRRSSTCRF
jgi:hypothetical protein